MRQKGLASVRDMAPLIFHPENTPFGARSEGPPATMFARRSVVPHSNSRSSTAAGMAPMYPCPPPAATAMGTAAMYPYPPPAATAMGVADMYPYPPPAATAMGMADMYPYPPPAAAAMGMAGMPPYHTSGYAKGGSKAERLARLKANQPFRRRKQPTIGGITAADVWGGYDPNYTHLDPSATYRNPGTGSQKIKPTLVQQFQGWAREDHLGNIFHAAKEAGRQVESTISGIPEGLGRQYRDFYREHGNMTNFMEKKTKGQINKVRNGR